MQTETQPCYRVFLRWSLLLAFIALVGCRGNSLPVAPQMENPSGSALFSIEIQADGDRLSVGETLQMTALGRDDRDAPIEVMPEWRSADPSIASISAQGVVTALKAGTVVIAATTRTPPREATFQLTIGPSDSLIRTPGPQPAAGTSPDIPPGPPPPPGYSLAIYPSVPRVAPGDKLRFLALQGPPGFETPAAAVWRSENPEIATIDEAGVVNALRPGTVTITAYSLAYPALAQQVTLAIIEPAPPAEISGIRIRPSRVVMNVGDSFWLQADVPTWTGGFDPLVRWESGDSSIVTVSETGQLRALAPGSTVVTATAIGYTQGNLSAYIPVEVRNVIAGRIRDTLF